MEWWYLKKWGALIETFVGSFIQYIHIYICVIIIIYMWYRCNTCTTFENGKLLITFAMSYLTYSDCPNRQFNDESSFFDTYLFIYLPIITWTYHQITNEQSTISNHRINQLFSTSPSLKSSGVGVCDEAVQVYQDLKLKKKYKYIVYKLSSDMKQVTVEKTETNTDYSNFIQSLPKDECRYCVYDFEYETPEGLRNKLLFVVWYRHTYTFI